jgi:hypothetical protein
MTQLNTKDINFGKVLLTILDVLIIRFFTIPYKIYVNALLALSNSDSDDSEEKNLSGEFPIYVWFVSIYNAIIALVYPVGVIIAIIGGINSPYGGFGVFFMTLIVTYFAPLSLGLLRELLQIVPENHF